MEMPGISVIVWLHETKEAYFRDLLESLVSQTYDRWELMCWIKIRPWFFFHGSRIFPGR